MALTVPDPVPEDVALPHVDLNGLVMELTRILNLYGHTINSILNAFAGLPTTLPGLISGVSSTFGSLVKTNAVEEIITTIPTPPGNGVLVIIAGLVSYGTVTNVTFSVRRGTGLGGAAIIQANTTINSYCPVLCAEASVNVAATYTLSATGNVGDSCFINQCVFLRLQL
jgi:hypothetical protein